MFREVAIVTFTAGMLGTSAATVVNGTEPLPASPPAIERAAEPAPAAGSAAVAGTRGRAKPKRELIVASPTE